MPRVATPVESEVRVSPAEVVTDNHRYRKARALVFPDYIIIQDQAKQDIEHIVGVTVRKIAEKVWEAVDADNQRVATIRWMSGCACGGVQITEVNGCVGCKGGH